MCISLLFIPLAPMTGSQGAAGDVAFGIVEDNEASSLGMAALLLCFLSTWESPNVLIYSVFVLFCFLFPGLWLSSGGSCLAHAKSPKPLPPAL